VRIVVDQRGDRWCLQGGVLVGGLWLRLVGRVARLGNGGSGVGGRGGVRLKGGGERRGNAGSVRGVGYGREWFRVD
jgi:hypothetical protein